MTEQIQKPSWFLHLTEFFRAIIDLIRCLFYLRSHPYQNIGDNHPIMVIPGLTASDFSMGLLRCFLKKHGYNNVYPWGLGRNLGDINNITILVEKLEKLSEQHQQKVTLIGWSLGGVFAREMAKQKPHLVRQVLTMGSPFAHIDAPNHARWVFELLQDVSKIDKKWEVQLPIPAPVPTTAIYSKLDGIVPWQACMEQIEDNFHKNIEVRSSHFGFGMNVQVFQILLEELKAKNTEGVTKTIQGQPQNQFYSATTP